MLRIPHCLDSRLTDGGEVVSHTHRPHITLEEDRLLFISFRGWGNPRAIVQLEGLGKLKKIQWTHRDSNPLVAKCPYIVGGSSSNRGCGISCTDGISRRFEPRTSSIWGLERHRYFSPLVSSRMYQTISLYILGYSILYQWLKFTEMSSGGVNLTLMITQVKLLRKRL
jgi:hypothetical protein